MDIKKADTKDLPDILSIYDFARMQMRLNGNPGQWGSSQPSEEILKKDIKNRNLYVMQKDGQIAGVFAFLVGDEPTYQFIEGRWLNDEPYGTVHRIAANGREKGVFEQCINYCASKMPNIRIDTHRNNTIMQHLLDKNGFTKCGIIYVADGTPRIAYQRTGLCSPII